MQPPSCTHTTHATAGCLQVSGTNEAPWEIGRAQAAVVHLVYDGEFDGCRWAAHARQPMQSPRQPCSRLAALPGWCACWHRLLGSTSYRVARRLAACPRLVARGARLSPPVTWCEPGGAGRGAEAASMGRAAQAAPAACGPLGSSAWRSAFTWAEHQASARRCRSLLRRWSARLRWSGKRRQARGSQWSACRRTWWRRCRPSCRHVHYRNSAQQGRP